MMLVRLKFSQKSTGHMYRACLAFSSVRPFRYAISLQSQPKANGRE